MRRIKCLLSYDGTNYCGYQKQKNAMTIQEKLEFSIDKIHNNRHVSTYAASRTDSGVHARGQVVHFDTDLNLDAKLFSRAINTFLPDDIRVIKSTEVSPNFHSRFYVKNKIYKYYISTCYDPSTYRYSKLVLEPLNIIKMNQEAKKIIGLHNFKSFTSKTIYDNYERLIYDIEVKKENSQIVVMIKGKGFLRYMVRTIVGTLIDIGLGKNIDLLDVIKAQDRKAASLTADAKGLFLEEINYVEGICQEEYL